eukprot:COSAG06_NODE_16929_length_972_cov_1.619702_1_plen_172_part_00
MQAVDARQRGTILQLAWREGAKHDRSTYHILPSLSWQNIQMLFKKGRFVLFVLAGNPSTANALGWVRITDPENGDAPLLEPEAEVSAPAQPQPQMIDAYLLRRKNLARQEHIAPSLPPPPPKQALKFNALAAAAAIGAGMLRLRGGRSLSVLCAEIRRLISCANTFRGTAS